MQLITTMLCVDFSNIQSSLARTHCWSPLFIVYWVNSSFLVELYSVNRLTSRISIDILGLAAALLDREQAFVVQTYSVLTRHQLTLAAFLLAACPTSTSSSFFSSPQTTPSTPRSCSASVWPSLGETLLQVGELAPFSYLSRMESMDLWWLPNAGSQLACSVEMKIM